MMRYSTVSHPILVCLSLLPAVFLNAARLEAKPTFSDSSRMGTQAQQRSVIDYFYLLPSLGIEDHTPRQERREMLQTKYHPVIDVRHDFLQVQPDSSPVEQIAVFRAHGRPDLIVDSQPDYQCEYNNFTFYRLQNGKLRGVTRRMLPVSLDTNRFLLKLPRFGTTIGVYRYASPDSTEATPPRHVFDLQWRGGRFVRVR